MDTKARSRTGTKRRSQAAKRSSAPIRRAASAARQERRSTRQVRQQTVRKRVVRAPKEDIPQVVYTAPKPFSRGKLLLRLVSVAAVVVAVLMCFNLFFRVDTITVAGADQYSAWVVREASGVEEGDSLLSIGRARVAGRIKTKLPYVNEVRVSIQLPGTVSIEITEHPVSYAIQTVDGDWWLVTASGTAVEQVPAVELAGYTRILGIQIAQPGVGHSIHAQAEPAATEPPASTETGVPEDTTQDPTAEQEEQAVLGQKLAAVLQILSSMEDNEIIGDAVSVDVTDLKDIRVQYSQYLLVRVGDEEQMAYKIRYMAAAVRQLDEYQNGELDLTFEYTDSAVFTPKD